MTPFRLLAGTTALLLVGLGGCTTEPSPSDYVARVGDQILTEHEVAEALHSMNLHMDSTEARQQIIEQWVTNTLLYQEARRRNLSRDPEVQKRLNQQRRSVLINELTTRLYEDFSPSPSPAEIRAYYERHREQMRLRRPFVRVRYLATPHPDSAAYVHTQLQGLDTSATADSTWSVFVSRLAAQPGTSRQLAASYYPETELFAKQPVLRQYLAQLDPGETASVIRTDSLSHVLQLVDRAPAGTIPKQAWVEDQIRRRLVIQARKQMYAREVQRLRNQALAREQLEIR